MAAGRTDGEERGLYKRVRPGHLEHIYLPSGNECVPDGRGTAKLGIELVGRVWKPNGGQPITATEPRLTVGGGLH